MKISEIVKRFKGSDKTVKLITFIGIAAMILILLSELIPKSSDSVKENAETAEKPVCSVSEYAAGTEKKLKELLSEIKGVGDAELILSVEGSEEYVYAEELETSSEKGEKDSSEKYKNKLFISEHNGSREAVVRKIINPRFNGALVICEGGGDPLVKERVIKAVSAALDLPTSKICVECRKN